MAQQVIRTEYGSTVVLSNIRKGKSSIPVIGMNDSYTATKVTTWYDGSPMTPEKADGSIYLRYKETGEYFRVNLPNDGQLFLEKDSVAQLRTMSAVEMLLLKMGYYKGVTLSGYYVEGDTPGAIQYYLSDTTESDDGGSVFGVGGIKLEHEFNGEVDVRYYGYFDGYVGEPFFNKIKGHKYILGNRSKYTFTSGEDFVVNKIIIQGNNSIIEASEDYDISSGVFLNFRYVTDSFYAENITIDIKQKCSECIRIFNPEDADVSVSKVKLINVVTKNGYRSSEIGLGSNNACGVYIRGSFDEVIIDSCKAIGFRSENIPNINSRGFFVGQDNNSTTWTRNIVFKDCYIEDISKPLGGVYDSDGIFCSNMFSTPYIEEERHRSKLIVDNCYFKNCYGRAVKSQVGNTVISNCTSVSDLYDQQVVFDFQRNQGVAFNNKIYLYNRGATIFGATLYDASLQDFNIYNNEVFATETTQKITFLNVGGTTGGAPYSTSFSGIKVHDNTIFSKITYFIEARIQSSSYDNFIDIRGNITSGFDAFIRTWGYGISTNYGLLKINFIGNINKDDNNSKVWLEDQRSTLYFSDHSGNIGFDQSFKYNVLRVASSDYDGDDYNIKCDGVQDQVEIRTCNSRFRGNVGVIELTEGIFNLSNSETSALDITENVSLIGEGSEVTILNILGNNSYGIRYLNTSVNSLAKGFKILCTGNNSQAGLYGNFSNSTLEDIVVENSKSRGIYQTPFGKNCKFFNIKSINSATVGILLNGEYITAVNITADGNGESGIYVYPTQDSRGNLLDNIQCRNNGSAGLLVSAGIGLSIKDSNFISINAKGNTGNDISLTDRAINNKIYLSSYDTINYSSTNTLILNQSTTVTDITTPDSTNEQETMDLVNELKAKINAMLARDRASGQMAT